MFHDRIAYPLSYGLASRLARVSAGGGVFFSGATLDMIFAANTYKGAVPADLTVTRASTAYAQDTTGTWTSFSSNVARITDKGLLVEEARTNSIRNSAATSATVGVIGSGGVLPNFWSSFNSAGSVVREVIGTGTENGVDYVDFRLSGTPSSTAGVVIYSETSTGIAAAISQVWTNSAFVKISGGSATNVASFRVGQVEHTAGGSYLTEGSSVFTPSSTLTRVSHTRTLTNASTGVVVPWVVINCTSGQAVDITLRIGWPQMELGAFATSPIRTTAGTVTRAADAVSLTGGAFTSWYGTPTAATVFAEYTFLTTGAISVANQSTLSISDGTLNNRLHLFRTLGGSDLNSRIVSGGSATNPGNIAGHGSATTYKAAIAAAIGASQGIACLSGTLSTASSPAAMPVSPTGTQFGANPSAGEHLNGYIRRVAFFPTRLSNATLQTITATTAYPRLVSLPVISGTATEGNTLTVSNGYWLEAPTSYTYQWTRDGANIGGATSRTFALTDTDGSKSIGCVVTATNANGSTAATANSALVGEAEPQNTVLPTITGTAAEDGILTAGVGTWTNSPTGYTYQWNRDGSPIGSATSSTYTLVTADVAALITVTVTASNAAGAGPSATSAAVGPILEALDALSLYAGGYLDLYGGGNLDLYMVGIPENAWLDTNGEPILDTDGQYILGV
jgi:hypothetical protein